VAHNRDVDDITHDKTQRDNAGTFVLLLVCMLSYSVVGWSMSSWCGTTSPLHSKVCRVFDGCWVCLMFPLHVSPLSHVGILNRFTRSWKLHACPSVCLWTHPCMFVCTSVCENIFAWSSIHEHIPFHASFVSLLMNMSFYMYSLCSYHFLSCHVCLCTCIWSYSWWDNIKSINLLINHDAWSFQMQVTKKGDKVVSCELGWRLWALLVKATQ